MGRTRGRVPAALVGVALAVLIGCRAVPAPPAERVPDADITPTVLDYTDADGFDALLEAALANQDPIIHVRTDREKPDWEGRLNAWIAAWNRGGRGKDRKARGQSPLPGVLDGKSLHELRLLVNDLFDRVEQAAQTGAAWWSRERERSRRVGLLRPYNLRFHISEQGTIHLVFFHGAYAAYYPRYVQQLTHASEPHPQEWSRAVECSRCLDDDGRQGKARLTGRGKE